MALVSQPLQTSGWTFSTITNNYEGRSASRKRGHDAGYGGRKETHGDGRGSSKRAKTVELVESALDAFDTSDASHDARAPHEYLAGDWRFEPLCQDTMPTEICLEEDMPSAEPVDVEKVISILLQALNAQSTENKPNDNENKPSSKQHHRHFTSPLSGSPNRMPFVRKAVGGPCRGRVDPGLQKWVLCKNHYDDICSYHPSRRSAEWIEALHEMGWENLHPTYMSQSQQTFKTLTAFSTSYDDWIDIKDAEEGYSTDGPDGGSEANGDQDLEGIHEDVWDLGLQAQFRRTTLVTS